MMILPAFGGQPHLGSTTSRFCRIKNSDLVNFDFWWSKEPFNMKFSGRSFPKDVILQCVRWYVAYCLSYS